jgi:F-type H+-transporting ATPase subunit b
MRFRSRFHLIGLMALLCVVPCFLRAQDEKGHAAGSKDEHSLLAAKYEITFHRHGGGEEIKTLNLNTPAELQTLVDLLKSGEVEELKKEKPINIFDLSWDLGLWTVVVFLLLLYALRKLAWGPMLSGLQKREDSIKSALEEAKRSNEESQKLRGQMAAQMAEAQEKVKAVLDGARRDAQSMADDLISKAKGEILADRQRLHREVELAKNQALEAISSRTAELATLVASKALGRGVEIQDQHRLIEEAIAGLGGEHQLRQKKGM